MDLINILIIGAKNINDTFDKDNINTYNNDKQASYNDLINLSIKYNVNINCIDQDYPNDNRLSYNIKFFKDTFNTINDKYLDINNTNIIIDFTNYLNETYPSSYLTNKCEFLNKFKIIWLDCRCDWSNGFPIDIIDILLKNPNYYTPTDNMKLENYIYSININKDIYEKKLDITLKPFLDGIYRVLGSFMNRGSIHNNYESENIIRNFIIKYDIYPEILNDDEKDKIKLFCNKKFIWNFLPRNIRLAYNRLIYGYNIIES